MLINYLILVKKVHKKTSYEQKSGIRVIYRDNQLCNIDAGW